MATPNTAVETVATGADKAKVAVAALLAIGGVAAYYLLPAAPVWQRVVALLVLIAAGVGIFFTAEPGKRLIAYGRDSYREVQKVVWPARSEAMQMTGYVFAFVFVMALFLWIADRTVQWVLYDLLLGWRR
jgi:preprotein translocase subunit SecE